ncbi:testis-specific serine/threonine-protein kinase 2 isoform X1 [Gigaspora margarita]|uniref:Testis-specific serine/threonine-protein kinase 2 isoform X1 n=1 Tax=Gigaspora margarita TaxID=4874 RepID=A0A8H4APC2_GIGMA|nr:testis-specific serine/threonine-protein kinase 2 isoform X1 [Gigaspora margarita]
MENLISDELIGGLAYDIQYEDDYKILYTSPELISGNNYNPEFFDLWSLGILLYTLIHADVPFEKLFEYNNQNINNRKRDQHRMYIAYLQKNLI